MAFHKRCRGHQHRSWGFSTNISISEKFNVTQGFDEFVYFEREPWLAKNRVRPDPGYVPIEGMMDDAVKWLDEIGEEDV